MAAAAHPLPLLLVQAGVIIVVARSLGVVMRRIGQPLVIAEVSAGILLGPSLLGWLWPEAMATLFPPTSLGNLGILSQVGLVFFMFLIGLEIDPRLLRGRGHASVVISHTSIIVPFGLGAALAYYLYPRVGDPGVPFSSFVLFLGIAMSITAFPVLARIMSERQILRTRMGAVTLACAAVDDVTAWCLLAFVVAIVGSTGLLDAAMTTVYSLLYIAVMFLAVRPLLRRLAERAIGGDALGQNTVAVTFLVLLASALTTEVIGIHALFGAFMAGAIMPRQHGLAHALATKVEDLVVIVLLPMFFAFSGLRTQIGLLDDAHAWMLCGLIILVASIGKFGGSMLAARWTGMPWREAGALGILMNTRGLMELIVLNIGLDLGVISPALFTMMVIMALVTTFATSPLLQVFYPQHLLQQDALEAIAEPPRPAAVAAPAQGPESVPSVLMCVADARSGPALLRMVHALSGGSGSPTALHLAPPSDRSSSYIPGEGAETADREAWLLPLRQASEKAGILVRPIAFISNDPGEDICRVAEAKGTDLILLGWHKPLFNRAALGGTVLEVLDGSPCDVGVVIDRGMPAFDGSPWPRKVLVPYCGTEHDRTSLALAKRLREEGGAEVVVLHVVEPERASEGVARQAVATTFPGDEAGVTMLVVPHGSPVDAVLAEATKGYDLVIVGIGPHWGLGPRHFGFHPERLVEECPTSLLVVHRARRQTAGTTRPI